MILYSLSQFKPGLLNWWSLQSESNGNEINGRVHTTYLSNPGSIPAALVYSVSFPSLLPLWNKG